MAAAGSLGSNPSAGIDRIRFDGFIPFILDVAAVLASLSPQSHRNSMFLGIRSFTAYLQLQLFWVYLSNNSFFAPR